MIKLKNSIFNALKIWLSAMLSIIIAEYFNLDFSVSAGVASILAIAPTKRETVKTAFRRLFAFMVAILIAFFTYNLLGYTLNAYYVYLLIFCIFCNICKCQNAIAMSSVFMSHFLTFEVMNISTISNEIYLFLIGTTLGIIANLHLRRKTEYMQKLKDETDEQIKIILLRMSENIMTISTDDYNGKCFEVLSDSIKNAKKLARENQMNQFTNNENFDIEYIIMREQQIQILQNIYKRIRSMKVIPDTAVDVSQYFKKVYEYYNKDALPTILISELNQLYELLKNSPLPESREEFEARADLYVVIREIEECLMVKVNFYNRNQELIKY